MTIEERATEFAREQSKCIHCGFCSKYEGLSCDKFDKYVQLYKEVAIDQQKIDIEKACEVLYGLANELSCNFLDIEIACKYMRKAMEEEQ